MFDVDWEAISAVATAAAVIVALGTTAFQEWRVQERVRSGSAALHQGAVDTVRQGWIAVSDAATFFHAPDNIDRLAAEARLKAILRARRLIKLFVAREVDPKILIGLLQMDDHLVEAESVLETAVGAARRGRVEYATFNGRLDSAASAAELIFISIA
jgi:hypothetical protein